MMNEQEQQEQQQSGLELLVPTPPQQVILRGNDVPVSLHGFDVNIHASDQLLNGAEASRKVRVSTVTNQNWEPKSFHGNIIASNNQYLAYVLESRAGHVVRIIQQKTKDRTLLKKFVGGVVDIAFAHSDSNMLAAIDEGGNVHVYDLDNAHGDVSKISNCLRLHIYHSPTVDNLTHRLVWCPHVPQSDDEDLEENLILAVSHEDKVEIFDLPEIATRYSPGIPLEFSKIEKGTTSILSAHQGSITDLSLSPDGNVLATAGDDGHVKFWKLNMDQKEEDPKCLHDYLPHDGLPVTRLLFLDNHLTQDPNTQFWRFLITAAHNNSVLKIWCTVKWKCLQTIQFLPSPNDQVIPKMLLSLDLSASYLLATDSERDVLYVMPVHQEAGIGDASISSITEYLLTQRILSFVLSGHTALPEEGGDSTGEEEEEEGGDKFNPRRNVVLLKLHCIQSKSMQELSVTFEPPDLTGIPPLDDMPPLEDESEGQPPISEGDTLSSPQSMNPPADYVTSGVVELESVTPPAGHTPYGPGQSSPAVKLLSPDSFLKSSPSSLTSYPSALSSPLIGGPVLCSPSDFGSQSLPNLSLPLLKTVNQSETDSHSNVADNHLVMNSSSEGGDGESGLLVAIPLQRLPSDKGEPQEEIVITPTATTPTTGQHDLSITFPSALNGISEDSFIESESTTHWNESESIIVQPGNESEPESSIVPLDNESQSAIVPPIETESKVVESGNEDESIVIASWTGNELESKTIPENVSTAKLSWNENESNTRPDILSKSPVEEEWPLLETPKSLPSIVSPPEDTTREQASAVVARAMANALAFVEERGEQPSADHIEPVDVTLLHQLVEQVAKQQQDIEAISCQQQALFEQLQSHMENTITTVTAQNTSGIQEMLREQNQRIERFIKNAESKRNDRLNQSVSQSIQNSIAGRLEKAVKTETKNVLVPTLQKSLTATQDQISGAVSDHLRVTDTAVRDGLQQILHTEGLVQGISNCVVGFLQQVIPVTMETLFTKTILPSFERSCQQMFRQLDEAFRRGTTEYLDQLHEQQRQTLDPAIHQLTTSLNTWMTSLASPNSPLLPSIQSCIQQEIISLKLGESLKQVISASVKQEMETLIEEKLIPATTAASQFSVKPHQERILQLLEDKQFDTAFNLALSTSDLQLVTFVCQNISPEEVFDANTSCQLSQPVLLSLIQQIAVDLSDNIELKIRYLEHAILSLDPADGVTAAHLPTIMRPLSAEITKTVDYLQQRNEGSAQLFRAMKRVRMLSEHVCQNVSGKR